MGRVDLYWIPLGSDGNPAVRMSGLLYERFVARREGRAPRPLFHSALLVGASNGPTYAIEMAPVWSEARPERGVVVEGAVGHPWLGRSRMFRYEVRCWADGVIPDLAAAVGGPVRLSATDEQVHLLLRIIPAFPPRTWGLDECGAGDMWNSNSLVSWLLASSGLPAALAPPLGGRAPGWTAGLVEASRRPVAQHAKEETT